MKYQGYTLIELMTVLGVVAILVVGGLPLLSVFFQGNRMVTNTNDLVGSLLIARSEAIRRGGRVSICQSADAATCAGTGQWEDGWIVFVDTANVCALDPGETILRAHTQTSGSKVTVRSDDVSNLISNCVSFTGRGLPKAANGVNLTGVFRICDDRQMAASSNGNTVARGIVLSASGRVRATKNLVKIQSKKATCT